MGILDAEVLKTKASFEKTTFEFLAHYTAHILLIIICSLLP